jgi:hypothetical protein
LKKPGEGGKLVRKVEKVLVTWKLEQRYPWPSVIMQYQGPYGTDFGKVLIFVSPTLAAMVIFYLMVQKHINAGFTLGELKG